MHCKRALSAYGRSHVTVRSILAISIPFDSSFVADCDVVDTFGCRAGNVRIVESGSDGPPDHRRLGGRIFGQDMWNVTTRVHSIAPLSRLHAVGRVRGTRPAPAAPRGSRLVAGGGAPFTNGSMRLPPGAGLLCLRPSERKRHRSGAADRSPAGSPPCAVGDRCLAVARSLWRIYSRSAAGGLVQGHGRMVSATRICHGTSGD